MNPNSMSLCSEYLQRLADQIDQHLPQYSPTLIPLERLPTIAALVREYLECEAILAGLKPAAADQPDGK